MTTDAESTAEKLEKMLAELRDEDQRTADDRRPVTLDQQSVGRVSRVDALQQQAMAKAVASRRHAMRRRIEAALVRLSDGEYGFCTECGEQIAAGRLALDPTVSRCVSCAQG